jgi:DNA polymerase III alpha subunit
VKTKLDGRTLWYDGVSEVAPKTLQHLLMQGVPLAKLAVTEMTADVIKLNEVSDDQVGLKTSIPDNTLPPEWSLPSKYKYLSLDELYYSLAEKIEHDELYELRLARFVEELGLFEKFELHDILKALKYIVDTMVEKQVVWGVGRGSSCSSYMLYLLGLHEVDVVRYDIPVTDFIKDI